MKTITKLFCLVLALTMLMGTAVFASGEASGGAPIGPPPGGGNKSSALPEDVVDLETIYAEQWVMTSDERVGLEGPAFDDEGNLYVCSTGLSYAINHIIRIDEEKNITTIWEGALSPLGLAFHENGKLFAVCREGEILVMDKDGSNVTSIVPTYGDWKFSLNDLAFTSEGDLFFTDWQGTADNPIGGIYLLTAESDYQEVQVIADKLIGPNGISLSPDEKTLWVGMTNEDAIYRIDLNYDSGEPAAEDVVLVYQNSGAGNPDSNKTDSAGNVYQAMIQGGRVLVLNSEGAPIMNVFIPGRDERSHMMSSNLAIKPGTNTAYLLTAGFGEGSWIYTFETLAEAKTGADAAATDPSGEASAEDVPVYGSTDETAYQAYLIAFVESCEDIQSSGSAGEYIALINKGDYVSFPVEMLFNEQWFGEAAMSYDEFVASGGVYEIVAHLSNGAMPDGTG